MYILDKYMVFKRKNIWYPFGTRLKNSRTFDLFPHF